MNGEKVRKIREAKKMTGRKLAELSGYSPAYISNLENNKNNPTIAVLECIAQVLDVPLSAIADEKFYYPLIEDAGLKVADSKVIHHSEVYEELKDLWLEIVQNWDIDEIKRLIVYLKSTNEYINEHKDK